MPTKYIVSSLGLNDKHRPPSEKIMRLELIVAENCKDNVEFFKPVLLSNYLLTSFGCLMFDFSIVL